MRIDLHIHTVESDGVCSVAEVFEAARRHGVGIISLTDHESTQGIAAAEELAGKSSMKIVPGVELLTSFQGQEVHLLGYYKNVDHPLLQSRLKELREHRTALAYDMVKLLQQGGIGVKWPDVEKAAGGEGAVSKGHIMRVLYQKERFSGKFDWGDVGAFFQPGGMAYLPFLEHRFEEAVDLILATGGMPVLAHPGLLRNPGIVPKLLSYRRIGLEVYYGYWKERQALIDYYAGVAREKALLATGGSDFHGPFSTVKIGQIDVPLKGVQILEDYLEIH
ncbi:DNA-directed DNA polymerase [Acididesulfobacillus acetoxydans]|uniref:DNA-directed DNA polymerase n=1 Tax=Acididesulfobacillus acetoxydans TaxID=1561005 RepID=A0A8S0WNM9_9FIRM|nr:PHP domain-containing protein [Acididesulfobacillus acetoxydans]CAA7601414.1 DNA-directed DNA polymerase [Acididesulfobacillus acetoxydans]CEJ08845.1 PHP domain protein [Acididesulfobacillus acetoxydans]